MSPENLKLTVKKLTLYIMRDFKQQMKAYGDEMKSSRCPYSEAELDKEIRSVIWNTQPQEVLTSATKLRMWPAAVAAAIVVAIIIPTAIFAGRGNTTAEIASVEVDGDHVYFACNNGCSADATIETFKKLLK